ncbi:MAG: alternative ribosome rescue aminoacyl-tRNA hydrolase ArfB [Holophaga sp.]|nr:alternative ribosome rescue aminoacyl-tRNA hydrolase ArfB [Holophaga sp.]
MPDPIQISNGVVVPAEALTVKAVRSGGPGGQNVNKVSSKIELRIQLEAITGITPEALERLRHAVRNRLDGDGRWMIISEKTRDQSKNLEDARAKAIHIIAEALVPPTPRHATRPTRGSKTRRLEAKRQIGDKKRQRGGKDFD